MSQAGPRVIFLGGIGRSGSTLIERLLGELPGVWPLGEVTHLWQRGVVDGEFCGCGQKFRECGFWSDVGKAAFDGWDAVGTERLMALRKALDRTRFIPRLARNGSAVPMSAELREYTDYYARLYRAAAEVSGARVVVDSSKHASLAFCLSHRADVDLRVIHVVRDSRAVAYSWTTKVLRPDSSTESYMATYSPAQAAAHWNGQNAAFQLLRRRGVPVLRVRYEDVVDETSQSLRAMAEFAGLEGRPDLSFLSVGTEGWSARLRAMHTASGNPMRFAAGAVVIHADERWRTAMPTHQRRLVTGLTFPLLARYGYVKGTP